jgi:hypothetical protein
VDSKALILFAKYPVKGKIKTRLAETLGDDFVYWFYKICAEHTFSEVDKLISVIDIIYFFYEGNKEDRVKDWVGRDFIFCKQSGSDIGIKMRNSFSRVFTSGIHKAVIVGTDIPDLTSEIIVEAFNSLNDCDVVISPSEDGGYYLLGMKKLYPFLFQDIKWSTDKVLNQTLDKIHTKGINKKVLKTLNDIDTEDDLKDWLNNSTSNSLLKIKIKSEFERMRQKA